MVHLMNPSLRLQICLPMVAPGKGLDEMFLPGSLSLDDEVSPAMEGDAPS